MLIENYDNIPLPLVILSEGWEVREVNRAFSTLFGASSESLRGVPAGELFSEVSAADIDSPWNMSTISGASGEEIRVAFRVQEIEGGYLLILIPGSDGYGLSAAFASSVAETFLRSEDRHNAYASQEQLSLLGHLAGGIAHDLNNILTGVLGHLTLLKNSLSEGHPSLAAAEDGAKKACATAQQILEFVRGRESKRQVVELSDIVKKVTNLLHVSFPKNIVLRTQLENAFVIGNESELSQLLMNLAINGRDAMPEGGSLTIKISRLVRNDQSFAVLSVKDTGDGVPEEYRHRIFEPFFTTKSPGKGTGLGLANVQRTVHRLGGTILFESETGIGSLFEVCLPLSENQVSEVKSEGEEAIPTGTENVLVVEDEETVQMVVQKSLEHLGYTVKVASNGVEAIELFSETPRIFDLIILDVMMPEMPGDELFFKIREIRPEVPVLIASGYASDSRTRKMLEAGCCGYLQKPFGVEDLAAEVRRCIDTYCGK